MNWKAHPQLAIAVDKIARGDVIAYPTEAVWGLGCDPFNRQAVDKVLALKSRPVDKGLILVAASIEQFEFVLYDLAVRQRQQLEQSWPGHHTWLVRHYGRGPVWVSGAFDTVALRVSQHEVVQAICKQYGGPIISTSANPAGCEPATSAFKSNKYFFGQVFHAPGNVGALGRPSTIQELSTGRIIRSA